MGAAHWPHDLRRQVVRQHRQLHQFRRRCAHRRRGKVFSMEAGKCASYDDDLGPGWKHLVAKREGGLLKLFVDGKLVAKSTSFDQATYDVSNDQPLRIGFGQTDYFAGRMADVRVYNRALKDGEIQKLATQDVSAARVQSARIVLAANASRIDKFAAAELQRCLVTALNWNVNISDEKQVSPDEPVIFVGSLDSDILERPDSRDR